MKNNFFKIVLPLGLLVFATFIIGSGCGSSVPDPVTFTCSTTGTEFQQLYDQVKIANPKFSDITTIDLTTHEYTFYVDTDETICSIGYQGNANLYTANIPYTIEIYNNSAGTLLYSGNHVFGSVSTSYKPITGVALSGGTSYTIKRIANDYLGDIANTTGRVLSFSAVSTVLPVTFGGLSIKATNFYGKGGPIPNAGIPYIDIVLEK
ncbi:hypothetical protein [Flavobacterium sp.]|uniref:hypothetical protein n=1 Tax=Flavobacterium sp. TaxID=239 RepID=UPI00286CDF91|nr:hypothetical protein [Flavobacterium sp.]